MRTDQAKRLTKLASEKIENSVYVTHQIAFHPFSKEHFATYRVTYFRSDTDCIGEDFSQWNTAEAFLKQLALKGLPDV